MKKILITFICFAAVLHAAAQQQNRQQDQPQNNFRARRAQQQKQWETPTPGGVPTGGVRDGVVQTINLGPGQQVVTYQNETTVYPIAGGTLTGTRTTAVPVTLRAADNDSSAPPRWAYNRLNIAPAFDAGLDGRGVNILVINSGFACDSQLDCSSGSIDVYNNTTDRTGRGAKLVKLIKSNGRLKGVAPMARIIVYAVPDTNGAASAASVNAALDFAINYNNTRVRPESKINVIFLGYGFLGYDASMAGKIRTLYNDSVTIVAGAGEDGLTTDINFPSNMPEVIAVGGMNSSSDWPLRMSNYNAQKNVIAFLAPGENVYTFTPGINSYDAVNGSSAAAALVSGLAALAIQSYKRDYGSYPTQDEVTRMLAASSIQIRGLAVQRQGYGVIDASNLAYLQMPV